MVKQHGRDWGQYVSVAARRRGKGKCLRLMHAWEKSRHLVDPGVFSLRCRVFVAQGHSCQQVHSLYPSRPSSQA